MTDLDPDLCVVAMERYTDKRRWLNLWTMLLWIFGVTVVLFSCVAILLFVRQTWLPGAITVLGTVVNGAGIAWVVTQRKGAEQEERDAFATFSTLCGRRRQSGRSSPSLQSAAADIPSVRELNSRAWRSLLRGGPN